MTKAFSARIRLLKRRGGRVVECTGLENRHAFAGIVGSNPTLSANYNSSAHPLHRQKAQQAMNIMQKSHFVAGIFFLALFLLTGVYMKLSFPELYEGREEIRMMFRATHIYLLMSALLNLMAGNGLRSHPVRHVVQLQKLASLLILIAPFLFFAAFIIEPPSYMLERPISFWGVVALLSGVLLHSALNANGVKALLLKRKK